MNVIIGTFLFLTCFCSADLDSEWTAFKSFYSKNYSSLREESYRYSIYQENKRYIDEHNKRAEKENGSFFLAMNKFGDLTLEEFNKKYNGYKPYLESHFFKGYPYAIPTNIVPKNKKDWRAEGLVTEVRDQGDCASCWAFSTTGSLEAQVFRFTGNLTKLSEQDLIDCDRLFGNAGCAGGVMTNALGYVAFYGGIESEKDYPYIGKNSECKSNKLKVANDGGVVLLPAGDEYALKLTVALVGPVSVAIDANHKSFQFYKEGIYYEQQCEVNLPSRAVLVVGYDTDKHDKDYWIIKNSFGHDWGEDGYMRMIRNEFNHCGVTSDALYPLYWPVFKDYK